MSEIKSVSEKAIRKVLDQVKGIMNVESGKGTRLDQIQGTIIGKFIQEVLTQRAAGNHLITDKLSDTSTIFVQNKSVDANVNGLKMLLHIYSEDESTNKKIRSIFLGGTIEDKGQEIIVSPITRLADTDRLLKIGEMLQEQLMDRISEK